MTNTFIDNLEIRKFESDDFDAVTILWRIAREKALPEFQRAKGHFFYEDREYFQKQILLNNEVWIAEMDHRIVAFIAMKDGFIDQFYVHPEFQRQGVGRVLLDFAKQCSPRHLWLYTLQINSNARLFYEKNGFVAEVFGMSPAPENEPDVQYHWRSA